MRVVFDTNVFISALVTPGGKGDQAFRRVMEGHVELAVSVPILTETANVLLGKFRWEREKVNRAVRLIAALGHMQHPDDPVTLCEHEPDNRILECARCAAADMIVTGDRHLLTLNHFGPAKIVTLAKFLAAPAKNG